MQKIIIPMKWRRIIIWVTCLLFSGRVFSQCTAQKDTIPCRFVIGLKKEQYKIIYIVPGFEIFDTKENCMMETIGYLNSKKKKLNNNSTFIFKTLPL